MQAEIPFILAGGGSLLAALFTYCVGYRRCAQRYETIRAVPSIATRDIPGLGAAMVEVNGHAQADVPLVSDLARVPCVAFTCSVTEHWTTTRTERDSNGKTRTVTEHHSSTRYSNDRRTDFELRDDTGEVLIRPEGASIDLLDTMGGLDGPMPGSPACDITPRHFNGHLHYSESALPVGQRLYILGQVGEDHAIQAPAGFDRPYIISHRSEAELCRSARIGKWVAGIAVLLMVIAGVALLVRGIEYPRQPMPHLQPQMLTPERYP